MDYSLESFFLLTFRKYFAKLKEYFICRNGEILVLKNCKIIVSIITCVAIILSTFVIGGMVANGETTYNVGDVVEYGSYPQSQVKDSGLLSALNSLTLNWQSYNYSFGNRNDIGGAQFWSSMYGNTIPDTSYPSSSSDYMKYADVVYEGQKFRAVIFNNYRPTHFYLTQNTDNSLQDDYNYSINEVYWFKFEPLRWRVLDADNGLLLSEMIIDGQSFVISWYTTVVSWTSDGYSKRCWNYYSDSSKKNFASDWNTSFLKEWMNNTFRNCALTNQQKTNISEIGLLTKSDCLNDFYGFDSSETSRISRYAELTDYAKIQGAIEDWWLGGGEGTGAGPIPSGSHITISNKEGTAGTEFKEIFTSAIGGVRVKLCVTNINECKLVKTSSPGSGILSIEMTNSDNGCDTYTIYLTDGTSFTFTIKNGVDGIGISSAVINGNGELVITLTNGTPLTLGVVKGADGQNGQDGITPQLKISDDNYWYVSYDNGATWESLGVKATGENGTNGQNGADGITPKLRINEETNFWEVSYDDGATWSSLGIKATGENGQNGQDGQNGTNGLDGQNGTTPQLRINGETNFWEVSYDNGTTWDNLNVKATGEKGQNGTDGQDGQNGQNGKDGKDGVNGQDGQDGKTPTLRINPDTLEWEASYDDGTTWNSLGIKAVGADGQNGTNGTNGTNGQNGHDGKDGKDGTNGKDGASIKSIYYDNDGNIVVELSDGTEIKTNENNNSSDYNLQAKPSVRIDGYKQNVSLYYGATISFHRTTENQSLGSTVHWFVNGEDKGTSETLTVSNVSNSFTVKAKIIKDGVVLAESEEENVTVKNGFFDRMVAFIKKLVSKKDFYIDQR